MYHQLSADLLDDHNELCLDDPAAGGRTPQLGAWAAKAGLFGCLGARGPRKAWDLQLFVFLFSIWCVLCSLSIGVGNHCDFSFLLPILWAFSKAHLIEQIPPGPMGLPCALKLIVVALFRKQFHWAFSLCHAEAGTTSEVAELTAQRLIRASG